MPFWHLVNGYQFNWVFQQRHYLIQEMACDVAYFGPYAEGVGMGTSEASIAQYVAQINSQYTALGATGRFLPISYRRVGSVNNGSTGNTFTGTNVGIFHPTRDFDLSPMSWGGLRNQGTTGHQVPFRKLARPVLLEKGIPIGMNLRATDEYHQTQMQRYMSISEGSGNNNVASVQIDATYAGYSLQVGGATGKTALELTADSGGNQFSPQQVQTNRALYKGGVMKLAILIKGFEVWGNWKKYFMDNASASKFVDMPTLTGALSGPARVNMGR